MDAKKKFGELFQYWISLIELFTTTSNLNNFLGVVEQILNNVYQSIEKIQADLKQETDIGCLLKTYVKDSLTSFENLDNQEAGIDLSNISSFTLMLQKKEPYLIRNDTELIALRQYINSEYLKLIELGDLANDFIDEGLSYSRIDKFQTLYYDHTITTEQCSICLTDFKPGHILMQVDCDGQHIFCKPCGKTWFNNKKTCAVCRHNFDH